MKEKNKRKMHGGASAKSYTGLVLTCVMTAIAVIYVGFAIYFESHFCFGTSIDGIAVGGSSVEKVEDAIRTEMKNYNLTVTAREDKNGTIAGSDIDMEPVFQGEIEKLLEEQNGFAWLILMFQKQEFELAKVVSYDEQKLDEAVRNLPCMKDQRTPVDATYSDYTRENGYALVPADYGTQVDTAKVRKAVSDAVLVLDETVDLEQSGCYLEPAIGDDDKDLLALIDALNQYVGVTITYDFGDDKEILDGTTISTWLSEGTDEKVSIDEEEVLAFVKTLAKKYNTAYSPKELKTSYGTTVTITGGFYGWRIDNGGEVEQILADLKAGKDVEREPVYLTTANSHGEHDYGDSYVEINLTNQHLFLYKDGKLVVESDFVSGNLSKGHDTPTGAFGLTYKTMNAVLRGPDYETPVTYWMPFNGDVEQAHGEGIVAHLEEFRDGCDAAAQQLGQEHERQHDQRERRGGLPGHRTHVARKCLSVRADKLFCGKVGHHQRTGDNDAGQSAACEKVAFLGGQVVIACFPPREHRDKHGERDKGCDSKCHFVVSPLFFNCVG